MGLVTSGCSASVLFLVLFTVKALEPTTECPPSRCNLRGPPIRFPFRLKGTQRPDCGYPGFDVSCTTGNDTVLELPVSVKLFISKIDYKSHKLHVYEPDGCLQKYIRNLNLSSSPFHFSYKQEDLEDYSLFNCSRQYLVSGRIELSCDEHYSGPVMTAFASSTSMKGMPSLLTCTKLYEVYQVPRDMLFQNTELVFNWSTPNCRKCEAGRRLCWLNRTNSLSETVCLSFHKGPPTRHVIIGVVVVVGTFFLGLVIALFHFHRLHKVEKRLETFLEDYKALKPTRYSYADIKRITSEFMEQLGHGAYGTVYKGKLSAEVPVAVKVLNDSTRNGEDFINEVSTMGRIHHVNVVRLVGFCADGFRRALVYEYLSKKSLEKYISSADNKNHFLG